MKDKRCLNCGNAIKGRADKRYCNDQCRAQYNNSKMTMASSIYIRNVNTILRKNRKILEEIIENAPHPKSKILSRQLYEKGYNFSYQTHIHTEKTGSVYFFCYEYGYTKLDKGFCKVVKREQV